MQRYAEQDVDDYVSDPQAVYASKYLLLALAENALSAANHVIASEGHRAPTDYADAFRSLREADVLEADLSARLEGMARFRNLLVHQYTQIDDRRVHEFMHQDLKDVDEYISSILNAFPDLEAK